MSKFISITTPGHDISITMYDKKTRLMENGRVAVSSLQATIERCASSETAGFLVGDFVHLRDTHYVAADADTSPFALDPESSASFVLPRAGADDGEFIAPAPVEDIHPPLSREWLNAIASTQIERFYPIGKQLTVERTGAPEAKAEMHAFIDAVLAVAHAYEGKPDTGVALPWPDPPASRVRSNPEGTPS